MSWLLSNKVVLICCALIALAVVIREVFLKVKGRKHSKIVDEDLKHLNIQLKEDLRQAKKKMKRGYIDQ